MESNLPQLWVGIFQKTGALIVFDRDLQIEGQPEVNLYSVNKGSIRPFEPVFARTKVVAAHGAARESALASYATWKSLDNGSFVREELSRIGAERLKTEQDKELQRLQLIERHRTYLASGGHQYLGTVLRVPKKPRTAHCWRCHQALDNSIDVECSSCHWILCNCGACGCGRDA